MSGISRIEKDEDFKSDIIFLKKLGFKPFNCDFADTSEHFIINLIKVNRKFPQIEET